MAYAKPNRTARRRAQYGTPAQPGHRTGPESFPQGQTRPLGDMTHLATLRRGRYRLISYADQKVEFLRGEPVPVNEAEFAKLSAEHERHTYFDGEARRVRHIPTWGFTDLDGEPVEVPVPDDEVVEAVA